MVVFFVFINENRAKTRTEEKPESIEADTEQLTETDEESIEFKENKNKIEIMDETLKVESVQVANYETVAEEVKTAN